MAIDDADKLDTQKSFHVLLKFPEPELPGYTGPTSYETVHYFVQCADESRAIAMVKSEQSVGYGGREQYTVKRAQECVKYLAEVGTNEHMFRIS